MRLNDGGTSPSVVVAGYQFCLTNGGPKTKYLHCEMKSLHMLSKQPTLWACCLQRAIMVVDYLVMHKARAPASMALT